ncbi:TPA: hypothetical protein ACFNMI_000484 [Neisseria bacilliformis]
MSKKMPECKEKSAASLDTLRAFLTQQAGVFCQKHRRKADCQQTLRPAAARYGGAAREKL